DSHVVVQHQHAPAMEVCTCAKRRRRGYRAVGHGGQGKRHRKPRAAPDGRPHLDTVSEEIGQPFYDGEPQPEPLAPVPLRIPQLMKLEKDVLESVRRNAGPVVVDVDSYRTGAPARSHQNATIDRVTQCVGNEVGEYSL